ncbi:MAG: DNA polymerase III subunit alpha [Chlamydiia bacterium]|nr:DNA polymerase III subunit alpha [Chlamydiia bacterium]MCH9618425.1 DNA polymerase III subunit alpha [Chlamydiia bacterium]MCH9623751.1 DNA polymerase III subunit alpha [Chlamydiia bacterium]
MQYTPLFLHSQYSILDATQSVKSLVHKAKSLGLSSIALTDFGNLYACVEFYSACKAAGIKPIIGLEVMMAPQSRLDKKRVPGKAPGAPIILLAKNQKGYENLCKISSIAHLEGFYYTPRIDKSVLKDHHEGLICLSGPAYGPLGTLVRGDNQKEIDEEVSFYKTLFGEDFYLQITLNRMTGNELKNCGVSDEAWVMQKMESGFKAQEEVLAAFKKLSEKEGIPLVVAPDIRYGEKEDYFAHEVMMNVASGETVQIIEQAGYGQEPNVYKNPKRKIASSYNLHFMSTEEIHDRYQGLSEAIANTNKIAELCHVDFDFDKQYYPVYTPPHLVGKKISAKKRLVEANNFLRKLCEDGIASRYGKEELARVQDKYPGEDTFEVIKKRLAYELEIIISKGMGDYLLIVYDFIHWAKQNKIPVGPGRGSGAGSIILYLIGITDIEPLGFNLFFERFINPERVSYPDIDVDICMERRSEVIRYTIEKYGSDKVAQIITFGTMKAKMAIKDVGRVLNMPLSRVNAIAKLIPDEIGTTIDGALSIDPELKRQMAEEKDVRLLLQLARKLEGSVRNTGVHAAGVIISERPLMELIPVCNAKDTELLVTQFSMKPVEKVGMLKIDFLGLKTLTSIQKTVDAIATHKGIELDWVNLSLNDKKTFDLLNQGKTAGIFQLESAGMQDLVRQLHVDHFEEIIAVGALYRPGPMEMIPSFICRKHGKEKIEYDHKALVDILNETYGIMVYQEQVMQIASLLAGYSLAEGDVLRRAMGKKDHEEMSSQKEKFRSGAKEKGVEDNVAVAIFEKIEKFASYGFNKSHATAYGYISYVTAYLKANFPYEWMAGLMTSDMQDISKVSKHIAEAGNMGISILPPDINESYPYFVATDEGVRFALSGIKGVGEGVVLEISEERRKNKKFLSLEDFLNRIDFSSVGKKMVENLILSGCFDFLEESRKGLFVYLQENFDRLAKLKKEKQKGILDFFADTDAEKVINNDDILQEEFEDLEKLKYEKELLGFYVTGHPLGSYKEAVDKLGCKNFEQVSAGEHGEVFKVPFVMDAVTVRISQRTKKKFAICIASDDDHRFDLPIWPDLYEKVAADLEENVLYIGIVAADKKDGSIRLSCKDLFKLEEIEEKEKDIEAAYKKAMRMSKKRTNYEEKEQKQMVPIKLHMDLDKMTMKGVLILRDMIKKFPGSRPLEIVFISKEKQMAKLYIEETRGVDPSDDMKAFFKSQKAVLDIIEEEEVSS